MSEFVYFRDVNTGKVVHAPRAWDKLFSNLVEVSPEEAECVDCWKTPEPEPVPDVTFDQPVQVRSRRSVSLTDPDEPKDNNDGE